MLPGHEKLLEALRVCRSEAIAAKRMHRSKSGMVRCLDARMARCFPGCRKGADMSEKLQLPTDLEAFISDAVRGTTQSTYEGDKVIFSQGESADSIFYIGKGKVKLTVLSEQGKEAVVAILSPGQFFGEGCMNGHARRIATTTAMEDCLITAITKAAMVGAIRHEPR